MQAPPSRARTAVLPAMLALCAWAPGQMQASFAERLQHWAWQPVLDPATPAVHDAAWVRDPIDAFVLARLERAGLQPAPPAPPHVWLRRVSFDLTGLPPSADQLRAFERDPSPAARARVVDALLSSPHYGERWARHWLDVVRYAESLGHEYDFCIPFAWRYRDYVVRALNADVPFDQFAIEHVAGDLLPEPRLDPVTGADESVQATASWWFAEQTHSPVDAKKHEADRIDNQIDVLTKAFLGVTVACARCHDHKFDAITSSDYYALYGFLESSRYVQQPVFPTARAADQRAQAAHRDLAALAAAVRGDEPLDPSLRGYQRIGSAFGMADVCQRGPFVTGVDDDAVHLLELPGTWLCSAALDRARDGALLSPTFPIALPFLHVEVAGEGARLQLVVDGLHLVRDPIYGGLHHAIDEPRPHWVTLDVRAWVGHRAHLQVLDQRAHDLADPDRDGEQYPDDAWVAVRRTVASADKRPPARRGTARELQLARSDDRVAEALLRWQDAVAALPPPATVPAMADGDGEDEHVFVRGDHRKPGELAPRRFLRAIAGDAAMELPAGSGRLQLARRMFAADDPLPARVLVNRIWHHLFGRGLVQSVDNFGHLGAPPTHPQLLDSLACDVVAGGWSQKHLIRRIVLSSTYAMDSRGVRAAEAADPDNRLLHRHNLRRLEGEVLRDALLAFAGRLDPQLYGPPVALPLDPDDKARGKPEVAGPIDGDGRRSLYLAMRRNFLPDLLVAFDLPRPFTTQGARSVGNVPAQALANDPLVHAMAQLAAERLPDRGADADAIADWFLATIARMPDDDESTQCRAFLAERRTQLQVADTDPRPWSELAHVLLQRKEFLYLR